MQQYLDCNQNDWHAEMREIQTMTKLAAERKRERREALKTDQEVELQCGNCRSFICMSSDIRKIKKSHHVIVDNTVEERVRMFPGSIPEYEDDDIKSGGELLCRSEGCRRNLGGVLEYKSRKFPLVKIQYFRVVYQSGKAETHKKWKNAKFRVDDYREIVKERRNEGPD